MNGKDEEKSGGSLFQGTIPAFAWIYWQMWCISSYTISLTIPHGVHCAGLLDFSVRGAVRQHFSRQVVQLFRRKFRQTSQDVVPCSGIFLSKWCSSFAGSSDGKMNVQSACALNTQYMSVLFLFFPLKLSVCVIKFQLVAHYNNIILGIILTDGLSGCFHSFQCI
jgi:hypothetical protein